MPVGTASASELVRLVFGAVCAAVTAWAGLRGWRRAAAVRTPLEVLAGFETLTVFAALALAELLLCGSELHAALTPAPTDAGVADLLDESGMSAAIVQLLLAAVAWERVVLRHLFRRVAPPGAESE